MSDCKALWRLVLWLKLSYTLGLRGRAKNYHRLIINPHQG